MWLSIVVLDLLLISNMLLYYCAGVFVMLCARLYVPFASVLCECYLCVRGIFVVAMLCVADRLW